MALHRFYCEHGPEPRFIVSALSASTVWVRWCKDARGIRRPHFGPDYRQPGRKPKPKQS